MSHLFLARENQLLAKFGLILEKSLIKIDILNNCVKVKFVGDELNLMSLVTFPLLFLFLFRSSGTSTLSHIPIYLLLVSNGSTARGMKTPL